MNLDIDYLINFMKKYSSPSKSELGEQETPPADQHKKNGNQVEKWVRHI